MAVGCQSLFLDDGLVTAAVLEWQSHDDYSFINDSPMTVTVLEYKTSMKITVLE